MFASVDRNVTTIPTIVIEIRTVVRDDSGQYYLNDKNKLRRK